MNKIKIKTWLLAGFSALCMLSACNDDEYSTGLEIHPIDELIGVYHDSSRTIKAYTYENENEIFVSNSQTNYMLGFCNDPHLGEFQNDIITHVSFSDLKYSFIDSAKSLTVQSVKLYLDFGYSDGDTTGLQSFSLYELSKNVSVRDLNDVELYEETLFDYYDQNNPLHTFQVQPRRSWPDTLSVIEIDLPIEFAERLLTDTIFQEGDTLLPYRNDSIFNAEILNGFYIKSNSNSQSKSISTLIMNDSTRLEVSYIKVYNDTLVDTVNYRYDIKSEYKANLFYKNLSEKIAYNKMYTDIEMATTDTVVYIKNNNGAYTQIRIDSIGNWNRKDSGNVVINKASILLELNEYDYADSSLATDYSPLSSVNVFREIGSSLYGLRAHLDASGNVSPISGRLTRAGYGYEIIITEEVQELFKNEQWDEPLHLIVRSSSNSGSPNRVILNSSTNNNPLKLLITYSKY